MNSIKNGYGDYMEMDKERKRKEFFDNLSKIKNHMNWCKIKLDPEEQEEITDPRMEYDYIGWQAEDDSILLELNKTQNIRHLSLIDIILKIHYMVCNFFVFDDLCYFLGKYDREKNVCTIDEKYGRNPNNEWLEARKKHNRRICFELSRYMACRIKQFATEECDVFLVSDEYESHYATAIISNNFMIVIDADDFIKAEDLNRVKLGLEIKGITIVSDEKKIVKNALEKININRKSKKDFDEEVKENAQKKDSLKWIAILLKKIHSIGNDGVFKYMVPILELKGYEPKKMWVKDGENYIQTIYMNWNMGYVVINSLGIEVLSERAFCDNIHEGKYLLNKNRSEVAKEFEYNG